MKFFSILPLAILSMGAFATAGRVGNLALKPPPAAKPAEGKITSLSMSCDVSAGCEFGTKTKAKNGNIIQKCVSIANASSKRMKGGKVRMLSATDKNSGDLIPINIYGKDKNFGTWINIQGNDIYSDYNETVVLGTIEPGQKFFVCQAFQVK